MLNTVSHIEIPSENLWPDDFEFGYGKVVPPIAILKQQATSLGQRTRNLVVGNVESQRGRNKDELQLDFVVSAPAIAYEYIPFFVYCPLINLYPIEISIPDELGMPNKHATAADEAAFKECLKDLFSTGGKIHSRIQSLIAQSVATAAN